MLCNSEHLEALIPQEGRDSDVSALVLFLFIIIFLLMLIVCTSFCNLMQCCSTKLYFQRITHKLGMFVFGFLL